MDCNPRSHVSSPRRILGWHVPAQSSSHPSTQAVGRVGSYSQSQEVDGVGVEDDAHPPEQLLPGHPSMPPEEPPITRASRWSECWEDVEVDTSDSGGQNKTVLKHIIQIGEPCTRAI